MIVHYDFIQVGLLCQDLDLFGACLFQCLHMELQCFLKCFGVFPGYLDQYLCVTLLCIHQCIQLRLDGCLKFPQFLLHSFAATGGAAACGLMFYSMSTAKTGLCAGQRLCMWLMVPPGKHSETTGHTCDPVTLKSLLSALCHLPLPHTPW